MKRRRFRSERGAALLEAAFTIPMLLLVGVGIFEFGRAYQYWQVMTNAAREGARVSVTPTGTVANTKLVVETYLEAGGLMDCNNAVCVQVDRMVPLGAGTASRVEIRYPFQFIVLQPIARLVGGNEQVGESLEMRVAAQMRNEAP